jgi:YHS domain-containing protein
MKSLIRAAAIGLAVATTTVTGALANGIEVNTTSTGLAMRGFDPVSYHNDGPKEGSFKITAVHEDATYRFVNEENKATFTANPTAYTPAYGGYCAYGLAVGSKFDGDPNVWKIVDGVLYLNLAKPVQKLWEKDIDGHLQSADSNWEKIKHTPAPETVE